MARRGTGTCATRRPRFSRNASAAPGTHRRRGRTRPGRTRERLRPPLQKEGSAQRARHSNACSRDSPRWRRPATIRWLGGRAAGLGTASRLAVVPRPVTGLGLGVQGGPERVAGHCVNAANKLGHVGAAPSLAQQVPGCTDPRGSAGNRQSLREIPYIVRPRPISDRARTRSSAAPSLHQALPCVSASANSRAGRSATSSMETSAAIRLQTGMTCGAAARKSSKDPHSADGKLAGGRPSHCGATR